MTQIDTVMERAFSKAGLNTAESIARRLAAEAMARHHNNARRAAVTFAKSLLASKTDVVAEAVLPYLRDYASRLLGDGQNSRATNGQGLDAVTQRPKANGAGQDRDAAHDAHAASVREPSATDRAASARVAKHLTITVFDTFRIRDGRGIGDVRYGELERLRASNAMEASLVRQLQRHGNPPHDTKMRDFVKVEELQRMVQRAAEVADAT